MLQDRSATSLFRHQRELSLKPRGDAQVAVRISVSVINNAGRIAGMRCQLEDITGLKSAHTELLEKSHRLNEMNKELRRFAKVTAHDLKEPVRMMVTNAQILKEDYAQKLTDDALTILSFIDEGGKLAISRLEDVLQYTTIEAPNLRTNFDTKKLVDILIAHRGPDLKKKSIKVTTASLPSTIWTLCTNSAQSSPDLG